MTARIRAIPSFRRSSTHTRARTKQSFCRWQASHSFARDSTSLHAHEMTAAAYRYVYLLCLLLRPIAVAGGGESRRLLSPFGVVVQKFSPRTGTRIRTIHVPPFSSFLLPSSESLHVAHPTATHSDPLLDLRGGETERREWDIDIDSCYRYGTVGVVSFLSDDIEGGGDGGKSMKHPRNIAIPLGGGIVDLLAFDNRDAALVGIPVVEGGDGCCAGGTVQGQEAFHSAAGCCCSSLVVRNDRDSVRCHHCHSGFERSAIQ